MLQTGMSAPMGIKVKGQDLEQIEAFGVQLEDILKKSMVLKTKLFLQTGLSESPICLLILIRERTGQIWHQCRRCAKCIKSGGGRNGLDPNR